MKAFLLDESLKFLWKELRESIDTITTTNKILSHKIQGNLPESDLTFTQSINTSCENVLNLISSFQEKRQREVAEKTSKLNRLYSFIKQINHNILCVKNEKTLFNNACHLALELGKFKMAWIGIVDRTNQEINLVAQSGISDHQIKLFQHLSYLPDRPLDKVLQRGRYYICNDIENEPELENWKPFATQNRIQSCMVLPIRKSDTIIGTFNLYASEVNFAENEEIDLLIEVTEDISFALDSLEKTKKLKITEELLERKRKKFRNTLEHMLEGVQIHDFKWRYIYVNDALVKYSTYSREELIGFTLMEKYPGIEQTELFKVLQRCMNDRVFENYETEFTFPNGTKAYFELSIQPVPEGLFILSMDKTEQKKANEKLLKVNRLYAFISSINQSIVHIQEEQELLNNASKVAVNIGAFRMAWIRLIDENNILQVVSFYGDDTVKKDQINFSGVDVTNPIYKGLPIINVINSGKYDFNNDIQHDPALEVWKEEFKKQGIFASISIPIVKFGKIVGVFGLHATSKNFFDEEEIKLLEEATHDLSFALENFEKAKKHREMEDLLLKNEKKFRHTLENMIEGVQIIDYNWKYIYVNDALVKYSTYSKEELLGYTVMEKYPGVEKTELFKKLNDCMNERIPYIIEDEFTFPNGTKAFFELSIQPVPEGIFIHSVDITEQKKANEKLLKANRLYAFLSAINQSIVHINDEQELFNNACQIAVKTGQFKRTWIGLLDQNDKLNLVSSQGLREEESDNSRFSSVDIHDPDLANLPIILSIKSGKFAFNNDIQNDPNLEKWKDLFKSEGVFASISLPIIKFGKIVGVFGLHATTKNFFDAEEINLLEEASRDISFALENFEKAKKHLETEELVIKNEKRFRALIEKSNDMKTLTNSEGNYIYVSPSVKKVLGYSEQELLNSSLFDLIHPQDLGDFKEKRNIIVQKSGASCTFEHRRKHKNGTWIWCEGTATNLLHEPGINALVSNFRDISERKKAEQQIAFDKNNMTALINSTRDLMWSLDRDFKLITFNKPFDKIIGNMSEIPIESGMDVLSLELGFSREQAVRFKTNYERAFAGEIFTEIERTFLPGENWAEISFHPIYKDDEVIGTACHSHDITKRKKLEEKRLLAEKRLNEAQAIAHLGSWDLNIATGVSVWSEELCRIYGISTEENEQTEAIWVSFIHPDDLDNVIEITEEKWNSLSNTNLNYRIILNDGTIKHIYSKSKFEFDENGNPVGLYGISHDVTEAKKAEELLTKSEAFNRGVLNALSSHIAVINNKGNIVAVNEAWRRFSIENGESDLQKTGVGSNYYQVCEKSASEGDETAVEVLQGMKAVLEEKTNVFYLEYPCHSLQEKRWFGLRILKFMGDEPMLVISHLDITERKLAEQELIFKNEELQKTNEELDRFVYSASHDMRSPLTSILGLVSLIEAETIEDNTLKYTEMIRISILRLDVFIKNILSYSRNNRTELEIEKIPVKQTIEEIIESLCNMHEADTIHFKSEISEEIPFYSNLPRFVMVLENIISNAIKYHKKDISGRYIKITGKSDKDNLQLQIEDNGIGIAAEHHTKIFDMFYRLPNKAAGSGIGLYIVKGIIDKLQGSIRLSSEEGIGTCFNIILKNLNT